MTIRADADTVDAYVERGWWGTTTLSEAVRANAERWPQRRAFIDDDGATTWAAYDQWATDLAAAFVATGLERGDRIAVMLPDGAAVHAVFVGAERAGLVVAGIGPRAGRREIEHLVGKTGATALVSLAVHREHDISTIAADLRRAGMPVRHHIVLDEAGSIISIDGAPPPVLSDTDRAEIGGRALGPDELFLLNSTSGTTGLPKCVMHSQNRWFYFHQLAVEAGEMTSDDVFLSAIPAPFGFGIWTAHVTPTLLGAPTVVSSKFAADRIIELIERERVTVLAAVSTQFIMMLGSPAMADHDLTSLRALFTGGEAVPYDRAARFETETGARVLQFYGSNETGALSRTTMADQRDKRLRTAGRVIDAMQVRLYDDDGNDITATGGPGQAGCRGPAACLGYYDDDAANAKLVRPDGWMLTGDVVTIDGDGYLSVVGRTSDIIIRGGKNISAPAVEDAVLTHPAIRMAAAVAMPSDVFGERVCLYVSLVPGAVLSLEDVCAHLHDDGVGKDMWPEHLVVLDELPVASGGKVAKAELRDDIKRRMAAEGAGTAVSE
jgi:acyl-CoA synthetase